MGFSQLPNGLTQVHHSFLCHIQLVLSFLQSGKCLQRESFTLDQVMTPKQNCERKKYTSNTFLQQKNHYCGALV